MLTKTQLRDLYYWLQLNRTLEDRLVSLYRANKVIGAVYSSRGQEAISIGTAYALQKGDLMAPMMRNIGALLVRGFAPEEILSQHLARSSGPTGGRDCNVHMGDLKRGVIAPTSTLGGLIPVMVGAALAAKMQKRNIVALTYIGDGGTNTTDFHEGLNLAAVQKVALVLVIENNGWANSTPTKKHTANPNFTTRSRAYGIAGFEVDGNDVVAVHEVACKATDHARKGLGPALITANTMRMRGYAEHDNGWYLPKKELEFWKARDPIRRFEDYLSEGGSITDAERTVILKRVRYEVDRATKIAENSPEPTGRSALVGVYHKA